MKKLCAVLLLGALSAPVACGGKVLVDGIQEAACAGCPPEGWTTTPDGGTWTLFGNECGGTPKNGNPLAMCSPPWCCIGDPQYFGGDGGVCMCGKHLGCKPTEVCCIPDPMSDWSCVPDMSTCWKG